MGSYASCSAAKNIHLEVVRYHDDGAAAQNERDVTRLQELADTRELQDERRRAAEGAPFFLSLGASG